jgi:lipid-A-disaccharide synthase
MLPILLKTAVLLNDRMKDTEFLMPITSSVFETSGLDIKYFKDHVKNWDVPVRIICDETYDVLSISDLSIITSGTATLEATCLGCPMVIVYKVSKATEWAARLLTHLPDYFGVPNLILGREAVPELLQESATPEMVSRACLDILDSPEKQQQIREDLTKVVRYLGKPGAGLRVAEHIRDML